MKLRPTEIEPLIRQALRFVRHEISAAKVTAATDFAGQLTTCALDRDKIKQALINLFANACHAMPGGGGRLLVSTRAWRVSEVDAVTPFKPGDLVVIVEIADSGTGIPKEQLSKIFDPYFTTKPPGELQRPRRGLVHARAVGVALLGGVSKSPAQACAQPLKRHWPAVENSVR